MAGFINKIRRGQKRGMGEKEKQQTGGSSVGCWGEGERWSLQSCCPCPLPGGTP
ncbi:rCG60802 [Rattus norvegicus]|uniref:RCG60802 n=1 Tax=Rattus norvegicus TaxID=10116 RepID=A6JJF3_RAT|nr:rCG60802 [Rattus norvegicus]